MKLSPYFYELRKAYQAELDDLVSDSEGKDVLRKRLAQKRSEIGFLVQMMEFSPEMVAVVFHQGFRFGKPAAMEQVLGLHADHLPDWHSLGHAVTLEPWAEGLAQTVLREPQGARFMTVAAALEYLHQQARMAPVAAGAEGDEEDADEEAAEHDDDFSALSADDARDPHTSRSREEASADWLADQGFERKE